MPRKRKSKQKFKEGKFTLRPTGRAYLSLKNKWIGIKIVLPTIAIKYMIIDYYNVEIIIIIIIIIILLQKEWEKETSKRKKKKGRKEERNEWSKSLPSPATILRTWRIQGKFYRISFTDMVVWWVWEILSGL